MIRWATAIYFYDHCRNDKLFLQKWFRLYCCQLVQVYSIILYCILYSGKLLRGKTSTNFAVWEPPAKVFSTKFGRALPTYTIDLAFRKMLTFTDLQNFSLLKVPAIWYMEIFSGENFLSCVNDYSHRRYCDLYENSFSQNFLQYKGS